VAQVLEQSKSNGGGVGAGSVDEKIEKLQSLLKMAKQ
jgi:hypothetical protein